MIAETIKLLHSGHWYGCGETIEMAKGKNAIPKTWKETKEKIKRIRHMQAAEIEEENTEKSKKDNVMAQREEITFDAEKIDSVVEKLKALTDALGTAKEKSKNFGEQFTSDGKKLLENKEAMKVLSEVTGGFSDKVQSAIEISKLFVTQQKAASLAQKAYTVVMAVCSAGLKLFRMALTSTGIGVIVIAVGLLIANFDKVKKVVMNMMGPLKAFGEMMGGFIEAFTDLIGVTSDASRALDKMAEDADKSLKRSQDFLDKYGDQYDEFTKAKLQANIDYQNKVKEINEDENKSEKEKLKDIADYAAKRNRMIDKADADRAAVNQKKKDEARQKELDKQKEAADKANKIAEKAAEDAKWKKEADAKEEERRNAISQIMDDYRKREENAVAKTNLEKIKLDEENALAELNRLGATLDEKAKIQEFYNKQRIIEEKRLSDELKAIEEGRQIALKNLEIDQKQWEIDHETDPVVKLEKQREVLEEQSKMELDKLQKDKDMAKKDTKEKAEAEAAYDMALQNLKQARADNDLELEKQKKANQDAQQKKDEELAKNRMDLSFVASSYLSDLMRKNSDEEDTRSDEDKERDRAVAQNRINVAGSTAKILADMGGKGAEFAKGMAVSQAIQDTYKGATAAYASMAEIPIVGPALGAAAAGVAVASGLMNVKKILATKPVEKSAPGGGGNGGGAAAPAAPAFNLVQGTGANQIAESIAGQNTPIQAYVVSSNVTSAQSLDRNIVEQSSL